MEFKEARKLRGDINYVMGHPLYDKEKGMWSEAAKLYRSLDGNEKMALADALQENGLKSLSPFGRGCYGAVFESAQNQMVTIYDANSEAAHITRIKSDTVLQTLVDPILIELGEGKVFKVDVTPMITDVEHALEQGLVSTRETVDAFYRMVDKIIENKLGTWPEDFYMCYNPRDLYEKGEHDLIRDFRFIKSEKPNPDDVMRVFYIGNTGFLSDFETLVTYDAGSIRAGKDSILDDEISPEQRAHTESLGLKYGEIKQYSEPEAAGWVERAKSIANKLRA